MTNKQQRKEIKLRAERAMKALKITFIKFSKGSNVEVEYAREKYKYLGDALHDLIAFSTSITSE